MNLKVEVWRCTCIFEMTSQLNPIYMPCDYLCGTWKESFVVEPIKRVRLNVTLIRMSQNSTMYTVRTSVNLTLQAMLHLTLHVTSNVTFYLTHITSIVISNARVTWRDVQIFSRYGCDGTHRRTRIQKGMWRSYFWDASIVPCSAEVGSTSITKYKIAETLSNSFELLCSSPAQRKADKQREEKNSTGKRHFSTPPPFSSHLFKSQ